MRYVFRIIELLLLTVLFACSSPPSNSPSEDPVKDIALPQDSFPETAPPPPPPPQKPTLQTGDLVRMESSIKDLVSTRDNQEITVHQIRITIDGESMFEGTWEFDSSSHKRLYVEQYYQDYDTETWKKLFYRDGQLFAVLDSEYIEGMEQDGWHEYTTKAHRDFCPTCALRTILTMNYDGIVIDSSTSLLAEGLFEDHESDLQKWENHHFGVIAQHLDSLTLPTPLSDSPKEQDLVDYDLALKDFEEYTSIEVVDTLMPGVPVTFLYEFDPELAHFIHSRQWK